MWRQRGQRAEATRLQLTEIMASSTKDGNHTITDQEYSYVTGLKETHAIILSILNIPLFISAVLGNILMIVALRKVSSLHSPSKLLLSCLSCTDLVMNLICHPLLLLYLSPQRNRLLVTPFGSFLLPRVLCLRVYLSQQRLQLVWTDFLLYCLGWDTGRWWLWGE